MMENTVNIDVQVIYYWNDHLVLRSNGDAEKITKAIEEGDFSTFMEIYAKYPPYEAIDEEFGAYLVSYFPKTASLVYRDQLIGSIDILNPLGFSLITYSEYECG